MTGTGIELPALAELVAAMRLIVDGVQIPRARRKAWFKDHIEPSYQLLKIIHVEYINKFQEAATLLKSNGDVRKIVEILREERPRKLFDRTEASALIRSLEGAMIQNNPFPRIKKSPSEMKQLFSMYVFGYEKYLNSASPLPRGGKNTTWYSTFIDEFSEAVEQGNNPYTLDYSSIAQGQASVGKAAIQLERAVHELMPEAFSKVQISYMNLRAYCTGAQI